jgi:exodeoxyribonuclease X
MYTAFEWQQTWKATAFAVIDVEGNGQQPPDLVEVAIASVERGVRQSVYSSLIRPPRPITPIVRRIHGISNEAVADAPQIAEIASEITDRLHGKIPLGHNVRIDIDALSRQLPTGWAPAFAIDTLLLAKRVLPSQPSYSLEKLRADLGLDVDGSAVTRHRAGADVVAAFDLFCTLISRLGSEPTLRELFQLAGIGYSTHPPEDDPTAQGSLFG